MAKRFTDTNKYDDPWYAELPVDMKQAWDYLQCKCDNSGVWTPNFRLAQFQLGATVKWDEFLKSAAGRIEVLSNGDWWIVDFVKGQCGELSVKSKPHQFVIRLLKQHGVYERYLKSINTLKEKDKEKEKEKNKKELIENFEDWLKIPEHGLHRENLKRVALTAGFRSNELDQAIHEVHLFINGNTGQNHAQGTQKFAYPNTKEALLSYFERCLSKGPLPNKRNTDQTQPRKLSLLE